MISLQCVKISIFKVTCLKCNEVYFYEAIKDFFFPLINCNAILYIIMMALNEIEENLFLWMRYGIWGARLYVLVYISFIVFVYYIYIRYTIVMSCIGVYDFFSCTLKFQTMMYMKQNKKTERKKCINIYKLYKYN